MSSRFQDGSGYVCVSIRFNYNGQFADELITNGYVDVQTEKGLRRKFHIKISTDNWHETFNIAYNFLNTLHQNQILLLPKAYLIHRHSGEQRMMHRNIFTLKNINGQTVTDVNYLA